ncbi:MAG: hypothetical protein ACOY58_02355 [Candidatus Micrarchaeota archaeon]
MKHPIFIAISLVLSITGCASTPHQTAHRAVDDAASEVAAYQAAGQVAGSIGSGAVAGLGILNHIFKPSVDAGSTCVNGLGQPVDCATKEPLQKMGAE